MGGRPENLVQIEPSDTLVFTLLPSPSSQVTFSISNVTLEQYIAFKVKTTNPQRYLVRPNQGIIGPEGKASITILVQEKHCHDLLQLTPQQRKDITDKFLIQSVIVDTNFCASLSGKIARDVAEDLNKLWNTISKNELYKKKLKCCFITEEETEDHGMERNFSEKDRLSTETNSLKDSWRQEQYDSYKLPPTMTHPEHREDDMDDGQTDKQKLEALRAKYDELVTYTVQVTAQRDCLTQDLEKAQKSAIDPSNNGLRNRRAAGSEKNSLSGSGRSGTNLRDQKRPQGNNNIVVYLIIALIAYIIGRYF